MDCRRKTPCHVYRVGSHTVPWCHMSQTVATYRVGSHNVSWCHRKHAATNRVVSCTCSVRSVYGSSSSSSSNTVSTSSNTSTVFPGLRDADIHNNTCLEKRVCAIPTFRAAPSALETTSSDRAWCNRQGSLPCRVRRPKPGVRVGVGSVK